jgi:tRNA dimethylallyltransferase
MVLERVETASRLAVLCGPTSVGKTALAVRLAERLNAEVISADSRAIYRGMDIGTAKPSEEQRRQVPHHLIDVADPGETFTLADYQRLAQRAIVAVRRRGRLPLICGGTGLYVRAVVDNLAIPPVAPNRALRLELEAEAQAHGPDHLHARLAARDPVAAASIHPRNVRRVVRALEVAITTGQPVSALQQRGGPAIPVAMVGLMMNRPALYAQIDARVEAQLAAGLVEEVTALLVRGIPADAPGMQALGYKEITGWLRGETGFDEAVRRLKHNTRQYARRQMTWFRRDPRITWIDIGSLDPGALLERVHAIMDAEFHRQGRA